MLLASAGLASVLLLLAGVAGHEELVAYAAPVLVVVLPLLAGRYVGEERIAGVAARLRRQRRLVGLPVVARTSRRVEVLLPRGGRLIASALAKRPPPVSVLG